MNVGRDPPEDNFVIVSRQTEMYGAIQRVVKGGDSLRASVQARWDVEARRRGRAKGREKCCGKTT